jgi:hypothetical protein
MPGALPEQRLAQVRLDGKWEHERWGRLKGGEQDWCIGERKTIRMLKTILAFVALVLGLLLLLVLGGGLLMVLAYGLGSALNRLMHFDPFQATALSLAALGLAGLGIARIISAFVASPSLSGAVADEDEWDEDEEDEWEEDEESEKVEDEPAPDRHPGIPRWRQPLRQIDFSKARPDDRCPCGSGRKYKNCHGRNRGA